jgi:hypothetical protein
MGKKAKFCELVTGVVSSVSERAIKITTRTVKDGGNYPKKEDERNACVHLSPPLEAKN